MPATNKPRKRKPKPAAVADPFRERIVERLCKLKIIELMELEAAAKGIWQAYRPDSSAADALPHARRIAELLAGDKEAKP
jgi:hypothetical protein